MKKHLYLLLIPAILFLSQCQEAKEEKTVQFVPQATVEEVINKIVAQYEEDAVYRVSKGVNQVASLWRESDGSAADFEAL